MKDTGDTENISYRQPVMVDLGGGIFVKETTAWWLVIHSEEHGDTVRNMAGRMLDDVVDADMEMHGEKPSVLQ